MNGLPCPSVALGLFSEDRPTDPKQSFWVAPMLHVLAEKTSYRPRVFIPADNLLKDLIVTTAGYDLSKPNTLPRVLSGKQGLRDLLYSAACRLRGGKSNLSSIPLVLFRKSKGVSQWALTEAGVSVAASIRPHFATDGRNVTNVWLNGQIEERGLYQRLLNAVTYSRTTSRERDPAEIHGHVNHFIALKIQNNAFSAKLISGDPPTFSQMKLYLLRSVYSTFMRRARDPLHRENKGARTLLEQEFGVQPSEAMVASEFSTVIQSDKCEHSGGVQSEVFVDNGAVDRDLHRLDFERGMTQVQEAFKRFKPKNHERIARIFDYMVEGFSREEIALLEGVSPNRASSLLADTRKALRDARKASADALEVLKYIQENPCSTIEDLLEDTSTTTKMTLLVEGLIEMGRIEAKCFNLRGCTRSTGFLVTDLGHGYIRTRPTVGDGILESLSF